MNAYLILGTVKPSERPDVFEIDFVDAVTVIYELTKKRY